MHLLLSFLLIAFDPSITHEEAAKLVTVITSTNPTPRLPSIKHLYKAQSSLSQIPAFKTCKKIIVFDGLCPGYKIEDYNAYKAEIQNLLGKDPNFLNTELIFCDHWVHLAGTIEEALKRVDTPYIFIHQHDDLLIQPFDLNGCLATMLANPSIKYIHLGRDPNNSEKALWWFKEIDNVVPLSSRVPLSRCFGWSDFAHLTTVEYYRDFVLPQCDFGAMEWWLHPSFRKAVEGKSKKERQLIHAQFGSYLYGRPEDGPYIRHLDSRRALDGQKERLPVYTEKNKDSSLRASS